MRETRSIALAGPRPENRVSAPVQVLPPVLSVLRLVGASELVAPGDFAEEDRGVSACRKRDLQANPFGLHRRGQILEVDEVVAARALQQLAEGAKSLPG